MGYQQKYRVAKTTAKSQKGWGCEVEPYPYSSEDTDSGPLSVATYIPGYRAQVSVVCNNTENVTKT